MAKIGYVILDETEDGIYSNSNGEFSVGAKCNKIIAFNSTRKKAVLQVWVDPDTEYACEIYPDLSQIKFRKYYANRQIFISGKPYSIDKIPDDYKMKGDQ